MKRIFHFSAKALRIILTAVILLSLLVTIFLNSNYFDRIIKKQIEERLSKALKRPVSVESVSFNPFFLDIQLNNFVIRNDARGPETAFFRAKSIYADVSWRYILGGKVRIQEVRLDEPELNVVFYKEGGNNFPSTGPKKEKKKGPGLDLIVSKVDCDNMMIVMNHRRVPLSFSVSDLETYVEYDTKQQNYYATTSYKDGYLKIMNYEFFKFDLKSNYRIIGDRVSFERLFLLSNKTKFYMAGEMYNLREPFFDFRFRSRISIDQTKHMFHLGPEMSGWGNFNAVYKGTFTKFRMQGRGNFRDFTFYSMPMDRAEFDLEMTDNWLNITNIRAGMFGGSYDGNFEIDPLKGTSVFKSDGVFKDWDGKRLGRFIRMKDMILPVKGSGSAKLLWKEGQFKNMSGDFQFNLEPYETGSFDIAAEAENSRFDNTLYSKPFILPVRNETRFKVEGGQLRDLQSLIEMPHTTAEVNGTIDMSGKADLVVRSQTEKIPEIDLLFHHLQSYFRNQSPALQKFWGVRGAATFEGKLDATVWNPFRPRLTGKVYGTNTWFHGVDLDQVEADVMFYDRLIEIYDSKMRTGNATGSAQATFNLGDRKRGTEDTMNLKGRVDNFPAKQIASAFYMDLPIKASIDASIELNGPFDELDGRSEFESGPGEMWGEPWDRASGTVLFFPDSLGLRDITAHLKDGYARASGDLLFGTYNYNVTFEASGIPVENLNILKRSNIEMSGIGSARGSGTGTLKRPAVNGEISLKNLTYKKETYGDVDATVELLPDHLAIKAIGASRGIASSAQGEMKLDGNLPFNAKFDIQKFPIEILIRAYSPELRELTGIVGGKFEMTGSMKPVSIDHLSGGLDSIHLDYAGLKFEQARPLDVELSDEIIQIRDSLIHGESSSISLTGNIYPKDGGRLDLNLSADIGLEILSSLDPNITASGTSTAKIAIAGTFDEPSLTGALEINNGFFRHFSFPNSLTDITALVSFRNKNISLQSLQANSSGGKMTAGGSATLKGYAFDDFRFDVYADQIRVHFPEGLRSTVNAEIHLQSGEETSYLVGDVEVLQGVYVRSFEETPTLFNYARVPSFAGLPGGAAAAAQKPLQLNIRIKSENLMVRNNFANIVSSADLNLTGSMENPVLVGRLDVDRGTITFRDREYEVSRGYLDFQNPYRTEALLNFVAETRVREYNITLNFNGTFDRIYHDLSSDPPLPRDDIYALLGAGYTRESLQGIADASALIAGQQISDFIASPITSPLEREFKRFFGLQRFQIDPVFVESQQAAAARITLEKDVSTDFSVTYSTNVFTVAEEIILLEYRLTDEIRVNAYKDERPRYGIDILVTKTFE